LKRPRSALKGRKAAGGAGRRPRSALRAEVKDGEALR